jgi:hypothetical protein
MDKLTAEEIRLLRREVTGKGGLVTSGFITITAKGRQWIAQDDERVKALRAAGGVKGKKYGKEGGRPVTKKAGKQ